MPRVHVRKVPHTVTLERFQALCRKLGIVGEVHFAREVDSGRYGGRAFVDTADAEDARRAAGLLSGYRIAGAQLEAQVVTESGFFDEDGLFADGAASMGRQDGEDREE